MRPKRTDDKYWTGTRNFNHIQYESDLEDYIIDLENENQHHNPCNNDNPDYMCDHCNCWKSTRKNCS